MGNYQLCPHCRQPLRAELLGLRWPKLKYDLLAAIKAAGALGITTEALLADLWHERGLVDRRTVCAHVWQINEEFELAGSRWRVVSSRNERPGASWRLIRY